MLLRQAINDFLDHVIGDPLEVLGADELRISLDLDGDRFRHLLRTHHGFRELGELFGIDDDGGQAALYQLCRVMETPRRARPSIGHPYHGGVALGGNAIQQAGGRRHR